MENVAIVGISSISSAGSSSNEILSKIKEGISSISEITYFDTTPFMSGVAGNISVGIWKEVMQISQDRDIDVSSALSILSIKKLIEDVRPETDKISLSVGTCNGGIASLENFFYTNEKSKLLNYPIYKQLNDISNYFGFQGKKYLFNNACSASGMALSYGADLISSGRSEVVIVGGSDPMSKMVFAGFNSLKAMNSDICEPYGKKIGLNLGEGATYFMLENISRAKKMGHKIFATILGYDTSNDAYHPTAPDVEGTGISSAIKGAISNSNLSPQDIVFINSHGTGTKANDISEFTGIKNVFGDSDLPYICSMKGYIGHNLGAAASTELALSLFALQEGMIVPNKPFERYRDGCDDKRIIKKTKRVSGDVVFINDNAAFGGHNVATALKVNTNGMYEQDMSLSLFTKEKEVYIDSISYVDNKIQKTLHETEELKGKSGLKEYNSSLYQRRMNELTQLSIIAADLAIEDKKKDNCGLIFGTPFGSMSSAEKYMQSIFEGGVDKASGIYFQDLVLNSTAGRICKAFGLKEYSASLSSGGNEDLKSLEVGFNAIKNGYCESLLVGAGHEKSELIDGILPDQFGSCATFAYLTTDRTNARFKVKNVDSFSFETYESLFEKTKPLLDRDLRVFIQDYNREDNCLEDKFSEYSRCNYLSSSSFKKLLEVQEEGGSFVLISISLGREAVVVEIEKIKEN
ncbi:beta-ketoacyl synthase N-terminal-like domain-containing protein [Lactococcus lactis]|uniref:beta-ketoacyl synthase N-terminal-like domain-containing protein n=1 Tax=Lactococcus lactis TaxID=1358 RepID=UPI0011115ECA|nr:beta-ketoacyl synthase N-terminal-like domain-containing protein [Lactococcus lactis]